MATTEPYDYDDCGWVRLWRVNGAARRICLAVVIAKVLYRQLVLFSQLSRQEHGAEHLPEIGRNTARSSKLRDHSKWPTIDKSFGACLMLKEDNNLLVEWLAYHYTILPMRFVVIGSDMNNRQNPLDILQRWDNTNLRYWVLNDTQFIHRHGVKTWQDFLDNATSRVPDERAAHHYFIHRQRGFITACSELLKQHGIEWAVYIDSDEYVFLNHLSGNENVNDASGNDSIQQRESLRNMSTVVDAIDNIESNFGSLSSCITMPRLTFGALENVSCSKVDDFKRRSSLSAVVPFQQTSTLRFFQHAETGDFAKNKFGKVMMNLGNFSLEGLSQRLPKNPHRPYTPECGPAFQKHDEAIFYIHHYLGSWERYYFSREDQRRNREQWESRAFLNDGIACNTGVHLWLERFVAQVGFDTAKYLLSSPG